MSHHHPSGHYTTPSTTANYESLADILEVGQRSLENQCITRSRPSYAWTKYAFGQVILVGIKIFGEQLETKAEGITGATTADTTTNVAIVSPPVWCSSVELSEDFYVWNKWQAGSSTQKASLWTMKEKGKWQHSMYKWSLYQTKLARRCLQDMTGHTACMWW